MFYRTLIILNLYSAPHLSILFSSVPLAIEKYNFLGISIVGQSNERGDGGIYIGSIMKGGAVAADGRIEPGDMLLQVSHSVMVCFGCFEEISKSCFCLVGERYQL